MNKNTVAIAFNGGSYGTYLEYCLTSLTLGVELPMPFKMHGNSHNFRGNHLDNMAGWNQYVSSDVEHQFVRFHPKTLEHDDLSKNLTQVADSVAQVVYLYPDQTTLLLGLNNFIYKVYRPSIVAYPLENEIDLEKIYKNWPVDQDTPISDVPAWIMREFLSFYLLPAWFDQIEWDHAAHFSHPKLITIRVPELLFDFEKTLLKIKEFCNLDYKMPISRLTEVHQKMLSLQQFLNHDQLCHQIIESVVNNTEFSWSKLSLSSEAWIQWQLRNLGFEIKCHGLDKFPTTSVQLKELLYPI
jgi:hypothetical protein